MNVYIDALLISALYGDESSHWIGDGRRMGDNQKLLRCCRRKYRLHTQQGIEPKSLVQLEIVVS
jgi:hypothetical protein